MMIQQQYPAATTESYFFFDNAAPKTGKRAYPHNITAAEASWQRRHAHGSALSSSGKYEEDNTMKHQPFASAAMISEPAYKKARVVSDDELEEPNAMNLTRVKRALQQLLLEQNNSDADEPMVVTKRARLELPVAAAAAQGPELPPSPEQETRIVLRDPSRPPRDPDTSEAERAIFNSLLLQRISNRYGRFAGLPFLDLVDSRLQELIRGSMRKGIASWSDDTTTTTAIASSPSANDVAMMEVEDSSQEEEESSSSSADLAMMTF